MTSDDQINWNNLDLSTAEKLHEFALAVEESGQRAVAKAIAEHKALGNPIYFGDENDPAILIKEMPDGRRYHVQLAEDGAETVLGSVEIQDSHLGLIVIQAWDGTLSADGRPMGEDGTALSGQTDGPWTQWTRQPAVRRGGAVGGPHGQPLA